MQSKIDLNSGGIETEVRVIALRILQGKLIAFIKESLTESNNFMSQETYKDIAGIGSFKDTFRKLLEQKCTIPQYVGEITGMSSQEYNYHAFGFNSDSEAIPVDDKDKGSKNRVVLERMKKVIANTPWYDLLCLNPIYGVKVTKFIILLNELQIDNLESLKKTLVELKEFDVVAGGIMGRFQTDELPKYPPLSQFDELQLKVELGEYYFSSARLRTVFLWAIAYQKNNLVEAILLALPATNFDLFFLQDAFNLSKHCNNIPAIKLLVQSELKLDTKYKTTMEIENRQIFPKNLLVNYIFQSTDMYPNLLNLLVFLQIINPFEAAEKTPSIQKFKDIYSSGKSALFFFNGFQDKNSRLALFDSDMAKEIIMKTLPQAGA